MLITHIMEAINKKYFGLYKEPLADIPNLVEMQKKSYDWLVDRKSVV